MVRKKWVLPGALVLSLLFASIALAASTPSIDWWVIGGGGGSTTVGSASLDSTIGQWLVGSDETGNLFLGHGFWGGGRDAGYLVFLPLVLRD
jgi:hypothetical protein